MTPEGTLRADGSAFCVAHRLRYDPQLRAGCVLCQRELLPAAAPARAPARALLAPLLLGSWLGVVVAFALELVPLVLSEPEHTSEGEPLTAASASEAAVAAPAPSRSTATAVPADRQAAASGPGIGVVPDLPELAGAPASGLSGAAVRGDLARIAAQLDARAAIDAQDGEGRSALAWAILALRQDAARLLIERGARVDLATHAGETPLTLAAARGLAPICALLLEHGADPVAATPKGTTATMLAARGGHDDVVALLLAHHAPIEARDGEGRSALMHAALFAAPPRTIALLLEHGAALEGRDIHGNTPLMLAGVLGREPTFGELLARGASVAARANNGWGVLDFVVQPRAGASERQLRDLAACLALLIRARVEPRLVFDPARVEIVLRTELDAWYRQLGLDPLPPLRAEASDARATGGAAISGELDSPATLALLEPASLHGDAPAPTAPSVLLGWRGWTRVPEIKARAVLRGVTLFGDQRATLAGDARGEDPWSVDGVLLLELMQDGQLVDIGFVGAVDGVEVAHAGVKRMGYPGREHVVGSVDLTPWLSIDGRELVLTLLSPGHADISRLYLRINGAGARRTVAHAEVDRSGRGGTL